MNGTLTAQVTFALTRILTVNIDDESLRVDLEDGRTISIPIGWYPRLSHATVAERTNFQISGAGYGIYWPNLDEDIGVEGILLGKKSTESPASFERWLANRKQSHSETRA
ncbi:MAG: DUF2442 domain-containing protein [Chloroflexi bacterium]|nr:DUF2442 domain-containing protein [Chloroflexota bacterium]